MQLPAVGAVRSTKRMRGRNYVKADDTEWTPAEYAAEVIRYRRGERKNPREELAFEIVPVDHATQAVANIERYLDRKRDLGRGWYGNAKSQNIAKRAPRADEAADLASVKGLKGREAERP